MNPPSALKIIGVKFVAPGEPGDLTWMIQQEEYSDAFFVFNDNLAQSRAYLAAKASGTLGPDAADDPCGAGGGNAKLRPFQCATDARAAGVPTGPGFASLDVPDVRQAIDNAIVNIRTLVGERHSQRLFYNAADETGTLGTGIFAVGDDVKAYIVQQLRSIAQ